MAGQLSALAGLGALRHLDLQLVGVDQVIGGDAEAGRGDLLDRAAPPVAVGIAREAGLVFAALAGVGLGADAVHGDRQRLVGFLADGAERHGAGGEALDDLGRRLDFLERHRRGGFLELHQAAQRAQVAALVVDGVGEFLEGLVVGLAHRVLQLADGRRIDQVILAAGAIGVVAADREFGLAVGDRAEGVLRASWRLRARAPPGRCRRCAKAFR